MPVYGCGLEVRPSETVVCPGAERLCVALRVAERRGRDLTPDPPLTDSGSRDRHEHADLQVFLVPVATLFASQRRVGESAFAVLTKHGVCGQRSPFPQSARRITRP